jgi:hypothetical protein
LGSWDGTIILNYQWILNVITHVLLRGRQREIWHRRQKKCGLDAKWQTAVFENGGRSHMPSNPKNVTLEAADII